MFFTVWAAFCRLTYGFSRRYFPAVLPYVVLACVILLIFWLGNRRRFDAFRDLWSALRGRAGVPAVVILTPGVHPVPGTSRVPGTDLAPGVHPVPGTDLAPGVHPVPGTNRVPGANRISLYIDPGTGSMLVTVLIGIAGAAVYSLRTRIMNMKMKIGGGKVVDAECVPFAVFSDNKRYYDIFAPVLREMDRRGRSVLYLTASEDDPVFECGLEKVTAEYIGPGNKVFTRLNNLKATVLLSTTPGLDVYQWKRSPGVSWYVHLPHAASDIILYRMFGTDYYDAILLSGKYQERDIRDLEELRGLPAKEIRLVGIPYMDVMAERLQREGPASEHERTVLLAPSWGKSALFGVYGAKIIEVLLKTGYHIIIRPHPHSFIAEKEMIDGLMAAYPESDRIEWNRDRDNFDVLRRSDILVSDFSGVIFDFALIYDKPVIYTDPDFDLAPYDAWWLKDTTLWTVTALPRLGRELTEENMENIKDLIDECIEDSRFAEGRREVKAETWEHVSRGAILTADYLCEKCDALMNGKEEA